VASDFDLWGPSLDGFARFEVPIGQVLVGGIGLMRAFDRLEVSGTSEVIVAMKEHGRGHFRRGFDVLGERLGTFAFGLVLTEKSRVMLVGLAGKRSRLSP